MIVGELGWGLLVEDEPLVRLTTAQTLQAVGYEVETARSCAVARRVEGRFDVGIFDISLPDGYGGDLAKELLERGVVQQAVFLTGLPGSQRAVRASRWGPVLSKGQGPDALLGVVEGLG